MKKGVDGYFRTQIEFFHEDTQAKVLAYSRWDDNGDRAKRSVQGDRVVVVANFSDKFLTDYHIPNFPASGRWYEYLNNFELEVDNKEIEISLPEYEAGVFVLGSG
ncbi:MAG: alpha amylase C-terminal domain-containing protein [Potamolinea sp.]